MKKEQIKFKASKRKDNKLEQKSIEKTNKTNSWFFRKINTIDKPLAKQKKKREDTND